MQSSSFCFVWVGFWFESGVIVVFLFVLLCLEFLRIWPCETSIHDRSVISASYSSDTTFASGITDNIIGLSFHKEVHYITIPPFNNTHAFPAIKSQFCKGAVFDIMTVNVASPVFP